MKIKKVLALLLALVLVTGLLVACGGGTPAADPRPAPEATPGAQTPPTGDAEESDEPIRIAYIVKAMTDQFWIEMRDGAVATAEEFGIELTFQAPDRETDVHIQMDMVENAIASGVDAIILSVADSRALIPAIVQANNAGIPVILVNDTIDEDALAAEGGFVETYVGIDQYASASLAGTFVAENFDGGQVVLLEGPPGVDALDQRLAGFWDQLAPLDGFELAASQNANVDRHEAFNVMQNLLTANPDISIVWAVNAEMGQGAIQAIEQMGFSGIYVFDFDASDDGIEAIKAGTLAGSVAQFPNLQARAAIEAALAALRGESLPAHTATRAELITIDNVFEFAAR